MHLVAFPFASTVLHHFFFFFIFIFHQVSFPLSARFSLFITMRTLLRLVCLSLTLLPLPFAFPALSERILILYRLLQHRTPLPISNRDDLDTTSSLDAIRCYNVPTAPLIQSLQLLGALVSLAAKRC